MSAPLADALRRLGLPLDETVDDGELGDAYRRAARENHPDGAPDDEREQRGETMRAINAARDLVRRSLELLSERAYTELSERENGSPAPAWWEDAIFEDPSGLGVRWNPGAVADPLAPALRAGAPRALHRRRRHASPSSSDGDAHARPRRGLRQLGARQPAHRLGRAARRAAAHRRRGALPRRLARRPSMPPTSARRAGTAPCAAARARSASRASAPARAASGARASTTTAGTTSAAAGAGCTASCASSTAWPRRSRPRRSPAFRDVDDGAGRRPRARRVAQRHDRGARRGARRRPRRASPSPRLRVARTRTPGRSRAPPARARPLRRRGQARAHGPRSHGRAARRAAPCASSSSTASARASSASYERVTRAASVRGATARPSATPSARPRPARAAQRRDRAERDRPRCDRAAGRIRELAAGAGQVAGRTGGHQRPVRRLRRRRATGGLRRIVAVSAGRFCACPAPCQVAGAASVTWPWKEAANGLRTPTLPDQDDRKIGLGRRGECPCGRSRTAGPPLHRRPIGTRRGCHLDDRHAPVTGRHSLAHRERGRLGP